MIQPLINTRIITIAVNLPGPACARRLKDFGATVIKIEPPSTMGGDPMQHYAPSYYQELHQGFEIIALNLKDAGDRAKFDAQLPIADVLITSHRLDALARLGLSAAQLASNFPRLCHIAIVGSETDSHAGHDLTYLADAGLLNPPHLPRTLVADLAGAERAVTATFAALRERDLTGKGAHVLVGLRETAESYAAPLRHHLTRPGDLLGGAHPGYHFYRARDGWIALAALEPQFVQRLKIALLIDVVTTELAPAFTARFAENNIAFWVRFATQHDIPLSVIADD